MKTLVFILVLFALAALYLYWRLRPYIKVARQIFGSARDVRSVNMRDEPSDLPRAREHAAGEKLVRCESCGTWIPASRSVRTGKSGAHYYCSHDCLERAAEKPSDARKSAS